VSAPVASEAPIDVAPAVEAAPVVAAAPVAPAVPQQISLLDAVETSPAPVVAQVVTPVVAPQAAPAPVQAAAHGNNGDQLESLQQMLSQAGLTLATTDPVKLRAAQEAAAAIVPAPRVPRERKPLPPQSTEPLVQVETRR